MKIIYVILFFLVVAGLMLLAGLIASKISPKTYHKMLKFWGMK